jgi:hypothetical protein
MIDYAGEDGMTVSNSLTAKSLASIERNTFSASDLQYMTIDCGVIFIRLTTVITRGIPQHEDPELDRAVHAPWRYKLPREPLRSDLPKAGAAKGRYRRRR